jgi:putative transferase (TIGR04331 family)
MPLRGESSNLFVREDSRFKSSDWAEFHAAFDEIHETFTKQLIEYHEELKLPVFSNFKLILMQITKPYCRLFGDLFFLSKNFESNYQIKENTLCIPREINDFGWYAEVGNYALRLWKEKSSFEEKKEFLDSMSFKPKAKQAISKKLRIVDFFICFFEKITRIGTNKKILLFTGTLSPARALTFIFQIRKSSIGTIVLRPKNKSILANTSFSSHFRLNSKVAFNNSVHQELLEALFFFCPAELLENFYEALGLADQIDSIKSELILSKGIFYNDSSMFIASVYKMNQGAKSFSIQHGGHYGVCAESSFEELEMQFSHTYLSWGKRPNSDPFVETKIFSNLNIKEIGASQIKKSIATGKVYIYLLSSPKMPYWRFSLAIGNQYHDYETEMDKLLGLVHDSAKKSIVLKQFPGSGGRDFEFTYSSKIEVEETHKPASSCMPRTAIAVHTYQSTGYVESLTANVPTILFFQEKYDQTRADFCALKLKMISCQVLFFDAQEASQRLNYLLECRSRIATWWFSESTQELRRELLIYLNLGAQDPKLGGIKHLSKLIAEAL